ncbi:MAG TPA: hypothetical protein VIM19_19145 [Actinomycetes bacterium]
MATAVSPVRTAAEPTSARLPASLVLLPAFLALLLATGVVGQASGVAAIALSALVVLLPSWRTTPVGALLVAAMAWLFLDGFVWHPEGDLGLPFLADALSLGLRAAAAVSASLLPRLRRRSR